MSVFRFELAGPKFVLNLHLKPKQFGRMKGNVVNIPQLLVLGNDLRWRHQPVSVLCFIVKLNKSIVFF